MNFSRILLTSHQRNITNDKIWVDFIFVDSNSSFNTSIF